MQRLLRMIKLSESFQDAAHSAMRRNDMNTAAFYEGIYYAMVNKIAVHLFITDHIYLN